MRKLRYMEYQDEWGREVEVRIIDEVKAKWIELVAALDLPNRTVANEKAKPGWTPDTACHNVLTTWLSGEGRDPHTWSTVIQALKEIGGFKVVIGKIKLALGVQ